MKRISKTEAIARAKAEGIDFEKDVYQISISDKSFMADLAKEAGYKKSASSCLSTGSAFFVHLKKYI